MEDCEDPPFRQKKGERMGHGCAVFRGQINNAKPLNQLAEANLAEFLDDFSDVLRTVAIDNQEGVLGIDDDQILYTDQSHKFASAVDVVVNGVDGHVAFGVGDVALAVTAQSGFELVLVKRGPGTKIVPGKLSGDAV